MADNVVAYGFVGLTHLFAQRATEINSRVIDTAINESAAEYNRAIAELTGALVTRTTLASERFLQPGTGTLQPVDEWGNPRPTQPGGFYDVAYPIQGAGDAFGTNRITREMITVGEINRQIVDVQTRDADWLRRHILASLLDNTGWTFGDPEVGNLAIKPLANGDSVLYPLIGGRPPATDSHYLAQAAGIADATNPFPTIETELLEHPSNRGSRIVAYVPTNLVADVEDLATFVPITDPDINPGANATTLTTAIGAGLGDTVLGKVGRVWVVEWMSLPDSYILAVAVDASSPVAMREYPVASLQGLFQEDGATNGNIAERRWLRFAGFGIRNRVAAVVVRIGNENYAIPSGYAQPLSV